MRWIYILKMLRLLYRVLFFILPPVIFVLVTETECIQRDHRLVHVRLREANCSLPCQRDDNGTCVDDCPKSSYCDDYFHTCVGCSQHCLLCTSSDFCEQCEDGFEIVGAGICEGSCDLGYYNSPYATKCLACSPNCVNCSGLNQCHNCSDNYSLYDDIARQVCVLPCGNGSFYNQTIDQCQACAEYCQHCIPSLGCVQCVDNYIINDNFCLLATPTVTLQPTITLTTSLPSIATPTITMQSTATPTITMQSTATPTSMKSPSNTVVQSTATPTATLQPAGSKKHNEAAYIVGGIGGGAIAMVTLTIVVMIVVYYRRRKSSVDSKPLLQFDDDSDELEEDGNNDKIL